MYRVNDIQHGPAEADWRETDDRLLLWPEVKRHTGVSRTTAWRMERTGGFPARVQLSPGRVGWWESDVTAWKMSRRLAQLAETARGRGRPRLDRVAEPPLNAARLARPPVQVTTQHLDKRVPIEILPDAVPDSSKTTDRSNPPGAGVGATVKHRRRSSRVAPGQLGFDF